jgi:hypothetical protein
VCSSDLEKILKHLIDSIDYQIKSIQTTLEVIKNSFGESNEYNVGSSEEIRKNNILEIKLEDFVAKIEDTYEPEYLEKE